MKLPIVGFASSMVGVVAGVLLVSVLDRDRNAPRVAPADPGIILNPGPVNAPDREPSQETVSELRVRLAIQASRLEALEKRVAQVQALTLVDAAGTTRSDAASESAPDPSESGRTDEIESGPAGSHKTRRARLQAAGIVGDDADAILGRVDEIQWRRTELRYRALHEGWANTERYREALGDLPDPRGAIVEEYGASAWDGYLFADGRPNRVAVRNVLNNSPAAQAGLRDGDLIVTYDGERVARVRDIISMAARGEPGQTVEMEVIRAGRTVTAYVPRGPVGFSGEAVSVNPQGSSLIGR